MRFTSVFLASLFLFLSPILFGEVGPIAENCSAEWQNWQKNYTSSSPFGAARKLQKHSLGEKEFNALLKKEIVNEGLIIVPLETPIARWDRSANAEAIVSGFAVDPLNYDRGLPAKTMTDNGLVPDRDRLMVAHLAQMVRNNPADNLLIVPIGTAHVLDYFLSGEDGARVMYGSQLNDEVTTHHSEGFRRYYNALPGNLRTMGLLGYENVFPQGFPRKLEARFTRYDYGNLFQLSLEKVYAAQVRLPQTWDGRKLSGGESDPKANVLFVAEQHNNLNHTTLEKLPSADCLRSRGFKSVTMVKEVFPRLEYGYASDLVHGMVSLQHELKARVFTLQGQPIPFPELLGRLAPDAAAVLMGSEIVEPTASSRAFAVASRLQREGMALHFLGLEAQPGTNLLSHLNVSPSPAMVADFRQWVAVDDRLQAARRGLLATGGHPAFALEIDNLTNAKRAVETHLSKYPVVPLAPNDETSKKINVQLRLD